MASISIGKQGLVRVLFTAADGKRKTIYLGKTPKKTAESIRIRVEHLLNAVSSRLPVDQETAKWVGGVGDDLHAKLAAAGLVPPRPKAVTLAGLLKLYGDEREAGNKPGTKTNHRTITNDLTRFFTPNIDPKTLTEDDAKRFLEHLRKRELASYTVARRIRRVRSIFAYSVKKKLLPSNPFTGIKASATLPEDRKAYVPPADAEKLLAVANPTWRTITALARFAGMRCPSEVFRLRWEDVDFANGRMTVPNLKTAGQTGKPYRACPLFAALRPHLEDAHELAAPGTVYVISGTLGDSIRAKMDGPNGSNDANVGTTFRKLIKRAGLTPWPRLFNTLRSSCETDLLESFPISAVVDWLGHSAAIALKHYARVPEHLFERAVGDMTTQNATRAGAAKTKHETTQPTEPLDISRLRRLLIAPGDSCQDTPMTLRGFEPRSIP